MNKNKNNHLEIAKGIWDDYYNREHPLKRQALENVTALQKCFGIDSETMQQAKLMVKEGKEDGR